MVHYLCRYIPAVFIDPINLVANHDLIGMLSLGDGYKYVPVGDINSSKKIKFDKWWSSAVIVDMNKKRYTRRDLVLALANKEGGAHVDPELNKEYADLTRKNSLGWIVHLPNGQSDEIEGGPEYVSVQQIAYETLRSLKFAFHDMFNNM
ncbi:MAG: hypothetical protein ACXVDJ_00680 [Tumebacillaceae bacterium]